MMFLLLANGGASFFIIAVFGGRSLMVVKLN